MDDVNNDEQSEDKWCRLLHAVISDVLKAVISSKVISDDVCNSLSFDAAAAAVAAVADDDD
jgi:hypothetical protein